MRSYFLFFLLGTAVLLHAQDSLITVTALPDEVRVGQIYNVSWNVQDADGGVTPPEEFPGFEKLGGPAQSTNVTNTNGVSVSTVSYGFSLRVVEAGIIALPVFHATVKGQEIARTSPPVRSLAAGATATTPIAMSQALVQAVYPDGMIATYVHEDGAYITQIQNGDEVVLRYLTNTEARELEAYLRQLATKK